MSSKAIHILHLSSHALCWATMMKKGRQYRIEAMGTLEGEVPDVLDRWLGQGGDRSTSSIRLYDSRPLVFSFMMNLPAKARRQLDDALRLRIRSELGLGPETVYWTARTAASAQNPHLLDVTAMVVRCDAMEDLEAWRDKHKLDALWVAPDFAAIAALASSGVIPAPATIVNCEAAVGNSSSPVAVYRMEASGAIFRNRARQLDMTAPSRTPGQPPPVFFGGDGTMPGSSGGNVGEFSALQPEGEAWQAFDGDSRLKELCRLDPVVLGGVLEHAKTNTPGRGLLESHVAQANPLMQRLERYKIKPLALGAIVLAVLTAGSIKTVTHMKENARLRVIQQASTAMREISALASEEAVLQQVKADRSPMIPIIESIHKAAPSDIVLDSLSIGDSGLIRIDGTSKNPDASNQFFKALAEDGQLEKVHMPQVSNAPQNKGFRFQLTAQMKGRK